MIVEGVLFKQNDKYYGYFKDWSNKKEYRVICKKYNDKKYNVFIENDDSKFKIIGTMIEIDPVEVRADKVYKQIGIIKLFDDDYSFSVLEHKSKSGKVYYKVI